MVVSASTSREDRFLYCQLAAQMEAELLQLPVEAGPDHANVQTLGSKVEDGSIAALIIGGNLVPAAMVNDSVYSVVIDALPSPVAEAASA